MIKEIVHDKFKDNLGKVIEEIIVYFGEEYRDQILEKAKDLQISLVEDKGVFSDGENEIYVGDEPLCIKGECPHVVIPLSFMGDSRGNVVLVHNLLHALTEDAFVKGSNDAFNEVIVDYMANEISKQLALKKINLTVAKPIYQSNSFYSHMFSEIDEFYQDNKQKIIDGRMGKKVIFDDIDEYIVGAQGVVDSVFLGDVSEDFTIRKVK